MKRHFSLLLAVSVVIVTAFAGGCKPSQKEEKQAPVATAVSPAATPVAASNVSGGPETVLLKASSGDITFPHHKHQQRGVACSVCHGNAVGKIAKLDMKWGHETCKGCHTSKGAGPTSCNGCHKK